MTKKGCVFIAKNLPRSNHGTKNDHFQLKNRKSGPILIVSYFPKSGLFWPPKIRKNTRTLCVHLVKWHPGPGGGSRDLYDLFFGLFWPSPVMIGVRGPKTWSKPWKIHQKSSKMAKKSSKNHQKIIKKVSSRKNLTSATYKQKHVKNMSKKWSKSTKKGPKKSKKYAFSWKSRAFTTAGSRKLRPPEVSDIPITV